jgi:AraC-like DNA-binding protein
MPTVSIDPLPRVAPTRAHPVRVNVRTLPANGHVATHAHDWAQLACTLRGAVRLRAGPTSWIVPPTRAVWIPPRVEHEVTLIGEVALRTVYVDASAAPRALTTCEVIDVSPLMREVIEALATTEPKTQAVRYELLTRLLLEQPGASLGLEEWAVRTGASPRTLARLFQQELGMTFGQWRQRVRLAHAAALVSTGQPLAAVAEKLGYESASAFSAMFKRVLGRSPREFFG